MRRRYTAEKRAQLVELVTSMKLTVAAAAAQLGVQGSTAGYWVRRARASGDGVSRALTRPTRAGATVTRGPAFARLVRADEASPLVEVWTRGVGIRVRAGFDAELLRAVVDALSGGVA